MKTHLKKRAWLALDTNARMYPPLLGGGSPTCFRISCILKEPVKPAFLKEAVDCITPGFPYFQHSLGKGFFWYYLQETSLKPLVIRDTGHVCRDFHRSMSEKLLLRILYGEHRISVECSHILTDGYGAMEYLKYLLERYLICAGLISKPFFSPPDFSESEYLEDSYRTFFRDDIPQAERPGKTYLSSASQLPNRQLRLICGEIDANSLKKQCTDSGVTITQYLGAAYLWSLYCQSRTEHTRPVPNVRIMVPVDLRRLYKSKTLRNFFVPVTCEILPFLGDYTFEEVLEEIRLQMTREVKPRFINLQIARNVSIINNIAVRLIPLALKDIILRYYYFHKGIQTVSGILSNLGRVQLPPEIEEHVDNWELLTSPNRILKTTLGVIGCKDRVIATFCNTTADTSIEREFFTILSKNKIRTKVYTNYQT